MRRDIHTIKSELHQRLEFSFGGFFEWSRDEQTEYRKLAERVGGIIVDLIGDELKELDKRVERLEESSRAS